MNRRSFLKRIAVAAAGVACGAAILTDRVTAHNVVCNSGLKTRPGFKDINPAWMSAQYETTFLFSKNSLDKLRQLMCGTKMESELAKWESFHSPRFEVHHGQWMELTA